VPCHPFVELLRVPLPFRFGLQFTTVANRFAETLSHRTMLVGRKTGGRAAVEEWNDRNGRATAAASVRVLSGFSKANECLSKMARAFTRDAVSAPVPEVSARVRVPSVWIFVVPSFRRFIREKCHHVISERLHNFVPVRTARYPS
jgi:hypothetical protein